MIEPQPTLSLWGTPCWGGSTWGWSDIESNRRIVGVMFFTAGSEDSRPWQDGGIEGVLSVEGGV